MNMVINAQIKATVSTTTIAMSRSRVLRHNPFANRRPFSHWAHRIAKDPLR
jgi:hypothetical protein